MVDVSKNITKVCSFYASDWHLITMLLPHVNKSIDQKIKITTILEEDTQEKVEILLSKLRIANKDKVLQIDWKNKLLNKEVIEESIKDIKEESEIIICGSNEYIKEVNKIIEENFIRNDVKNKITIIDCYFIEDNSNIKEILDNHDVILNTAGERSVEEFIKTVNL